MASKNPQTMAKRAREQAVREKRERKRAKKDERAAERAAALDGPALDETGEPETSDGSPLDEAGEPETPADPEPI